MPTATSTALTYEAWAPHYDEWNDVNSYTVTGVEHSVASRILDALPPGRMLDAACGTGRWAKHMAAQGWEAYMVDLSLPMLSNGSASLESGDSAFATLANLKALPFPPTCFELVICSFAMLHISDLPRVVEELARVTSNSGIVMITDIHPSLQFEWGENKQIRISGSTYPFPCFHYSIDKYITAAKENRLKLVAKYQLKALIDDLVKEAVIVLFFIKEVVPPETIEI